MQKKIDSNTGLKLVSRVCLLCSSLVLVSCGERDESQEGSEFQMAAEPADSSTTTALQRNAADNASSSLAVTLQSIVETMNGSAAIGSAFTVPGLGLTAEQPDGDGVFSDPTESGPLINPSFDTRVRDESGSLFETSLGLSGNATTERNGNLIIIDPDESDMCAQQGELVGDTICEQLFADLRVTINALSDSSGTISYLFRDQSVLEIDYSPELGSYELNLAGIQSMALRINEIDAQSEPAPDTMSGAVKFEARVSNANVGTEAGSMSLSISESMSIVDSSTGTDISISPSTLLEIVSDAGTGAASVEVAIGAMAVTSRNDELAGNPLQNLVLSGITARADVSTNGDVLTVSNIGLGNGPLVMSVDSLESVRATLDTFGFIVDAGSNTIELDGDLNFSATFNNILGSLDATTSHDSSSSFSLSAASGTTFAEMASGVMRINQGGPLSLIYDIFDGSTSQNGSISVNQGECFGEQLNSSSPIDVVGCI